MNVSIGYHYFVPSFYSLLIVPLTHDTRSGAYKAFSAEGNYVRTTKSAYKSTNTYGKEESTMLMVHEVCLGH